MASISAPRDCNISSYCVFMAEPWAGVSGIGKDLIVVTWPRSMSSSGSGRTTSSNGVFVSFFCERCRLLRT